MDTLTCLDVEWALYVFTVESYDLFDEGVFASFEPCAHVQRIASAFPNERWLFVCLMVRVRLQVLLGRWA